MTTLQVPPDDLDALAACWASLSLDLASLAPDLAPHLAGGLEPGARAAAADLLVTWRRLVEDLATRCDQHAVAVRATARDHVLADDAVAGALRRLGQRLGLSGAPA